MSRSKTCTKTPNEATAEQIAAEILATASKTAGKANLTSFDRAAKFTEAAKRSKRYNYDRMVVPGAPIYYFHRPGESLTGTLGQSQRGQILRGSVTWEYLVPIVLDDGTLLYLPNNKRLRKAIELADCLFQRVTITYEGRLATAHGHYEKVYSVKPAPLGKKGVGEVGGTILAKAAAEALARKRRRLPHTTDQ